MQKIRMLIVVGMAVLFAATAGHAASRKALVQRITDANQYVKDVMEAPDTAIPQSLLKTVVVLSFCDSTKQGLASVWKAG